MAEEIKIIIGADSSDLSAQLAKAEQDLKRFQETLKSSTSTDEIDNLNKKIVETISIINQLKVALASIKINVDNTDANNKIDDTKNQAQNIGTTAPIELTANNSDVINKINEDKDLINTVSASTPLQLTADNTDVIEKVNEDKDLINTVSSSTPLQLTADNTDVIEKVNEDKDLINSVSSPTPIDFTADNSDVINKSEEVKNEEEGLVNPPPIEFTADTKQLQAELTKSQNLLRQFEAALRKSTNIGEIEYLSRNIALLKGKIDTLNVAQGKLSAGSNKAAFALNDLSRIAQDAPYGFIGIQNNINPLLESFQRLSAEAKNTGQSVSKLLVGALTGPAGLGLALGATISAITFAQVGFSRWTGSAGQASAAAGEFRGSLEDLNIQLKDSKLEIDNLLESLDFAQKLQELQIRLQITGADDIANFKRSLAELDIKKLTNLSKQEPIAIKISDITQVGGTLEQYARAAEKVIDDQKDVINFWNESGNSARKLIDDVGGLENAYKLSDDQLKKLGGAEFAVKRYIGEQKAVKDLKDKLQELQREYKLIGLQTQVLTQIEKDRIAALEKEKDTIEKTLAKLKEDLRDQTEISIFLNQSTLDEQIKLVDSAIKKLISDFNIPLDDKRIIKLKLQLKDLEGKKFKEDVGTIITKTQYLLNQENLSPDFDVDNIKNKIKIVEGGIKDLQNLQLKEGDIVDPKIFDDLNAALDKFKKQLFELETSKIKIPEVDISEIDKLPPEIKSQLDTIVKLVEDEAAQIGVIFGTAFMAAVSGQDSGLKSAFQSLFTIFADAVIQLGKYAIEYSTLIQALKKALESASGITGIAVGIALIALGTIIKSAISGIGKKSGFAVGTNYAPGGMALVGERGPELVNLPRGSQVIPAGRTAQMMGGIGNQIEVFGMLRGQDIYFSNKKYGQTYGRTT